ncbi:hypothetical protein [Peptoniphilus catoniae]|uniref:hypothetical protein n=1 Tax=Peptoniphilus catoniae TaxID=1660341 RepID=UPI0015D5C9C9|nr:hypothetical protein [Peptoniphilus catoniae]
MFFNQLTIPCFAATGAIKEEMNDKKWFTFAIVYQIVFSYTIAFMIYQFGRVLFEGGAVNGCTFGAVAVLLAYIYLLFRPEIKGNVEQLRSVEVRQ